VQGIMGGTLSLRIPSNKLDELRSNGKGGVV
jgi:hypothetical protein